jgi:flagellar basal-body rod protein FlgB
MFENVFGLHERALLLRADRVGVLATNIANADTPNYKARDLDFAAVLAGQEPGGMQVQMVRTSTAHLGAATAGITEGDLKYRIPYQPALDGNTVEAPVEQAQFAENAVRYQASLMFVTRRIQSLELALSGQ